MSKNKKPTKVQTEGRAPTYDELREGVLMDELRARHWKAQYETAYYNLEFEKILPAYKELLAKQAEEARKAREELVAEMEKNASLEGTLGETIKIEDVAPVTEENGLTIPELKEEL